MIAPCRGCADRHEACWDHCEKYRQWKTLKDGENESLKQLRKSSMRKIGGNRKRPEFNRTGVWKHRDTTRTEEEHESHS